MATWIGVVTNAGRDLFASWIEGTELNFNGMTGAEGGTGTVPEAALLAQTALVNKKQNLTIVSQEKTANGIKLKIQITAPSAGYTLNQIGLKGSVDGGAMTLLAIYQNATGVTIPSNSDTPDFIYNFFGIVEVSNTGEITLTIDPSAIVSQSTLDASLATKQNKITANGILVGDGNGGITAAVAGNDFGYPLLKDSSDPATSTIGLVGQHYFNTTTGKEFVCVRKDGANYIWEKVGGGGDIDTIDATKVTYTPQGSSVAMAVNTALDGMASAIQAMPDMYVPTTRRINNKPLIGDINLNHVDVGAAAYDLANVTNSIMLAKGVAAGLAKADLANVDTAVFLAKILASGAIKTFVLRITFGSSLSGRPFTVNGGGFSYSGTVPSSLVAEIEVPSPFTAYTIVCSIYTETVITSGFFGYYEVGMAMPFGSSSWAQIAAASLSGNIPSHWAAGDTKDILRTTGETLTVEIGDFAHDDLADGSGKAGISIALKNLMAETRRMNATNTNVGSIAASELQGWLINTVYPTLPADLRAVIRTVNKKTSAGSGSSTINTNAMDLFLFSVIEVLGTNTSSVAGEGTQYPIFTNAANRRKYLANGTGAEGDWWTRSPRNSGSTQFISMVKGSASVTTASTVNGVCFGFCV